MKTRRGTGYYRVPSLKGVWYRGPFEHSGSVATLEDWFDENRLKPDYVPTGCGFGREATLYVPDRIDEGYGLNVQAIQAIAQGRASKA